MAVPQRLHGIERPKGSQYSFSDVEKPSPTRTNALMMAVTGSDDYVEKSDPVRQSVRACHAAGHGGSGTMNAAVDVERTVTSLIAFDEIGRTVGGITQKGSLPNWRLKRAVEYIDAHYSRTITLRDLAAAAGLSPMRFAAQFRLATGQRPREFILKRRIQFSQALLADTQANVLEIALIVGFQTQAHFTTVFKRFVGETPHRWRCADALTSDFQSRVRHGAAGAEVLPDESSDKP